MNNHEQVTAANYMEHPIRRVAEPNGVRAKILRRRSEYPEILAKLAATFTRDHLLQWVDVASQAANAWSDRNHARNAGQDLFDAQCGVYDLVALIGMIRESAETSRDEAPTGGAA